jgi:AraC family transcriptional regulator
MNAIGKALWYIESHSAGPVTLESVAEVSGLSRFHLSRTFTAVVGRSFAAYLRGRRLSEAARSLADGAPDILSVALEAGYGSHEAFTRAFRDQFGLTPEDVRGRRSTANLLLVEPQRMSDTPAQTLADPDIRASEAILIAGLRQRFTHETRAGIPALWQRLAPHLGHIPGEKRGVSFGVVLSEPDGDRDGFDYQVGVEVASLNDLPEDLAGLRIPPRRYAAFRHAGHVSAVGTTCGAIFGSWLPRSGYQLAPGPVQLIERYDLSKFDPRTGQGGFEIWIPLEK